MEETSIKGNLFFVAALIGMLPQSNARSDGLGSTWVSQPRSAVTIVIGEDGGRITGPGWEHSFDSRARTLDFEIAPERRLVLRRSGNAWVGEYFHPRIGPGTHERDEHRMTFACRAGACAQGR